MDIDKLDKFLGELLEFGLDEAKNAFEFFKTEWPKLSQDERKMLSSYLAGAVIKLTENSDNRKATLYWLAIVTYSEKAVADGKIIEETNEEIFPRLKLSDGLNGNQITKLFLKLKEKGVFVSTCTIDHLAEAISIIFPIEYGTAYNDLSQPKRLIKVEDLLP